MTPADPARSTPRRRRGSPLSREDAWQRAVEFLFERLAVRWEIAGTEPITRQKELLGRYRFASADERRWIRDVLREHLAEHFPDVARRDARPGDTSGRARAEQAVTGPDPDAFARLLCGYCLDAQAGQQVVVRSGTLAAPLLLAVQRELLEREAWPLLRTELPGQSEGWWAAARDAHLDAFAPAELLEAEGTQASLVIQAPENTRALAGVPPDRMARAARARRPVREAGLRRRWCGTFWPTPAAAQQAGMGTAEFAAFVRRATFLDQDDPVAAWTELSTRQAALIARLAGAREIHIEAEGTDLRLRVEGRTWVNSDGRRNMPSGEVFTGPHEDSAEGTLRVSIPSSPRGVAVEGVELVFREGRVVDARAERRRGLPPGHAGHGPRRAAAGRAGHRHQRGHRPARRARSCSTRRSAARSTSPLGSSYPETGGTNESAVHWDLIVDLRRGGRLSADGEVIQEDGVFAAVA